MSSETRIVVASLSNKKISVALPEDITLYCPRCKEKSSVEILEENITVLS